MGPAQWVSATCGSLATNVPIMLLQSVQSTLGLTSGRGCSNLRAERRPRRAFAATSTCVNVWPSADISICSRKVVGAYTRDQLWVSACHAGAHAVRTQRTVDVDRCILKR